MTQARSANRAEKLSTQPLQMAAPFFSSSGAPWASVDRQNIQARARFMRLAAHLRVGGNADAANAGALS
ncbi:hypothetical protein D9M69_655130 [compost metagenome]